jgi:hypothetical protein
MEWNKAPGGLNIPVAEEYDNPNTPPEITDKHIVFNGTGDDGHETFILCFGQQEWSFCKTARKPYDVLVVTVLMFCECYAPGAWDIGSDGNNDDWAEGMTIAAGIVAALEQQAVA